MARTLALAVVFAAQLGSVFHLGLVPHEVCEEHGELIELTADQREQSHGGSPAPTAEEHEHCPLLVNDGHAALPAPIELVTPVLVASTAAGGPSFRVATKPSVAILDVAPKTSPPV